MVHNGSIKIVSDKNEISDSEILLNYYKWWKGEQNKMLATEYDHGVCDKIWKKGLKKPHQNRSIH